MDAGPNSEDTVTMNDIISLRAIAHDGTDIPITVTGTGDRFLFLGYGTASALDTSGMKPWSDGLGDEYRLIFIDYPGELKLYTLTPPTVARDFLAVADKHGIGNPFGDAPHVIVAESAGRSGCHESSIE